MDKRNVLITGGTRGIGNAIVGILEKTDKYNILAPTRIELELMDSNSIENFIKKNTNIDIIINSAGINNIDYIQDLKDENIKIMLMTNLIAPIKLIRGIVPNMMAKKYGRILNISSIWGITSKEKRTIYSATKFGLNGITKTLSKELGKYNILVNSICPGYVNTEMTKKNVTEMEKQEILKNIPVGRFAEPVEIGYLAEFLISDRNRYITGQSLIIDGGFTA